MEGQCLFQDAGEGDQGHHGEDGGVHCRGVDVLNAHESGENEDQDRCSKDVHGFEPAPHEAEHNA